MSKCKPRWKALHEELLREMAIDKLRRKRSAAIKAVAEANAALDAHLKWWNSPVSKKFDEEAALKIEGATSVLQVLEYHLAIELNNLCYIDQELEYGSVEIIERTEAAWAVRERAAEKKIA